MLFDENIGFFGFKIPSLESEDTLTTVKEGFLKGNMFKYSYDKYKDYEYKKIIASNKQEELLLEIMALSFAINDINLYLDLHPNDEHMLKEFSELSEELCKKELEYVKCYGPLEATDNESLKKFEWINNPWPWENVEGIKYV